MSRNKASGRANQDWHVIESGERWYRAIKVFSSSASDVVTVKSWACGQHADLLGALDRPECSIRVVLWEVPICTHRLATTLDSIMDLSRLGSCLIQLAVPEIARWDARIWYEVSLAVQEAGVSMLLSDLWSPRFIMGRLSQAGWTVADNSRGSSDL